MKLSTRLLPASLLMVAFSRIQAAAQAPENTTTIDTLSVRGLLPTRAKLWKRSIGNPEWQLFYDSGLGWHAVNANRFFLVRSESIEPCGQHATKCSFSADPLSPTAGVTR